MTSKNRSVFGVYHDRPAVEEAIDAQQRSENCFENSVWKPDVIPSYTIGETHLTFDSPDEWGEGLPPVCLHRISDGHYQHRSEGIAYDAVRADTETHVVLTGRWTEPDFGKGVFIAVFPIKLSDDIPLETVVSLPVEGQVTAAVAQPVSKDLASTKGRLLVPTGDHHQSCIRDDLRLHWADQDADVCACRVRSDCVSPALYRCKWVGNSGPDTAAFRLPMFTLNAVGGRVNCQAFRNAISNLFPSGRRSARNRGLFSFDIDRQTVIQIVAR